jgi:hypothetical protein
MEIFRQGYGRGSVSTGPLAGPFPDRLAPVAVVRRNGFETAIVVPCETTHPAVSASTHPEQSWPSRQRSISETEIDEGSAAGAALMVRRRLYRPR